jgi:Uma2 family endonuclease
MLPGALLTLYEGRTPGTEAADNTTVLLGDEGEPQPDLFLRILPEFGGQSKTTRKDYVKGAPELVLEIAHSSRAIDLHLKRHDYERYDVLEYLVLCLQERQIRWFDLREKRELSADAERILRIRTFPGLWIDHDAVVTKDIQRAIGVLERGLATPDHEAFVKELAAAREAEAKA